MLAPRKRDAVEPRSANIAASISRWHARRIMHGHHHRRVRIHRAELVEHTLRTTVLRQNVMDNSNFHSAWLHPGVACQRTEAYTSRLIDYGAWIWISVLLV